MFVLLFVMSAFSIVLTAQECTIETLLQKPGVWKTSPKGSEGGTAADLAREKKTIAAIHTMIKSK